MVRWWILGCVVLGLSSASALESKLREIGRYGALVAYSNEADTGTHKGERQCVDLVKRWFEANNRTWVPIGVAENFYSLAETGALSVRGVFPNNGSGPPKPGDILCFTGRGAGHVAVVTAVTGGSVTVLEQNWSRDQGLRRLRLRKQDQRYHVDAGSRDYQVQGWCRILNDTVPKPIGEPSRYLSCLILDCSASRTPELKQALLQQAIDAYLSVQKPKDVVSVVVYHHLAERVLGRHLAESAQEYRTYLKQRTEVEHRPNVQAALQEAYKTCVDSQLKVVPRFVWVSEGRDQRSDWRPALDRFVGRGWPITVVEIGDRPEREILIEVAQKTGGKYYQLQSGGAERIFRQIFPN